MDPEDLREVITAYQNCVAETVRRFNGFVAQCLVQASESLDSIIPGHPSKDALNWWLE
jgi:hypothetical protein